MTAAYPVPDWISSGVMVLTTNVFVLCQNTDWSEDPASVWHAFGNPHVMPDGARFSPDARQDRNLPLPP